MPAKQITRPCGWCKVPQSARDDRKHFAVCPKRPKQIVAAQKRLREFSESLSIAILRDEEEIRFKAGDTLSVNFTGTCSGCGGFVIGGGCTCA